MGHRQIRSLDHVGPKDVITAQHSARLCTNAFEAVQDNTFLKIWTQVLVPVCSKSLNQSSELCFQDKVITKNELLYPKNVLLTFPSFPIFQSLSSFIFDLHFFFTRSK